RHPPRRRAPSRRRQKTQTRVPEAHRPATRKPRPQLLHPPGLLQRHPDRRWHARVALVHRQPQPRLPPLPRRLPRKVRKRETVLRFARRQGGRQSTFHRSEPHLTPRISFGFWFLVS